MLDTKSSPFEASQMQAGFTSFFSLNTQVLGATGIDFFFYSFF